jgi:ATP-dependent Lhr-like helicase
MLVSGSVRRDRLFAGLRAVVVDEVHAFARDDRDWHRLETVDRRAMERLSTADAFQGAFRPDG